MVRPAIHGYDAQGRPLDKRGRVIQSLVPLGGRKESTQDSEAQEAEAKRQAEYAAKEQERFERDQQKTGATMGLGPRVRRRRNRPVLDELREIKEALTK